MLTRWLSLSADERRALARAFVLVATLRALLLLRPLARVLSRVRRWAPTVASPSRPLARSVLVWAVRASSRRLVRRNPCLTEALALWVLLRRNGHACDLRIGVAREGDVGFEAHAWVESDGEILIGGERSPERYAPLPAFEIE